MSERRSAITLGLASVAVALPLALLASLPGLVYIAGFDHLAYGLGLLAGIVIAGALIAPHVVSHKAGSIFEALRNRFGAGTAIVAGIFAVLVSIPLLTAELSFAAILGEAVLGVSFLSAVLAGAIVALAIAFFANERAFAWIATITFVFVAVSLIGSLFAVGFARHGTVLPFFTFGEALSQISGLEEKLLENGLVDFDTFSVHITPFLRLPQRGFVALIIALALGTAVLFPLVAALARAGRPSAVRMSGAWAALFAMLLLISVPPLAAYAKLEIYTAMTSAAPLANVPAWLVAPLDAGLATIHGTSPFLLNAVVDAIRAGHQDAASIATAVSLNATASAQWTALIPETQQAIIAAAQTLAGDSQSSVWAVYTQSVLPVAASNAGNDAAVLTQAALVLSPPGLLLALPELFGGPAWIAGLIGLAGIAAALVMCASLIRSLTVISQAEQRDCRVCRLAFGLAPVLIAAALATLRIDNLVTIIVAALSLGASAFFPVLALGFSWKRATSMAAIAAMIAGGGTALYYDVGIQAFPVSFYKTWAPLSNAGEFAIENFHATEMDAVDAETEEARIEASSALEGLARGMPGRPGLANWFGIESASGAIFGVPLGFLVLILVSLLTGRTRRDQP